MKLKSFLKSIGSTVLASLPPYGPIALAAVNAVLPKDQQLDGTSTGESAITAINTLPAESRASLLEKTLIEEHSTLRSMLAAESKNNHSTRPKIAYQAFQVYASCTIMITAVICATLFNDADPLAKINLMWPTLAVLYGPFPAVLYAYFGMLRDEHKCRLNAANGHNSGVGIMSAIIGKALNR